MEWNVLQDFEAILSVSTLSVISLSSFLYLTVSGASPCANEHVAREDTHTFGLYSCLRDVHVGMGSSR
jgi:hypothetical protein